MGTRYAHMDTLGTTTRHIVPAGQKVGADQLTRPRLGRRQRRRLPHHPGRTGDLVTLVMRPTCQLTFERFLVASAMAAFGTVGSTP